jgi:hypothetical protein
MKSNGSKLVPRPPNRSNTARPTNIYQFLKNRGQANQNPASLADLHDLKDQLDIPDSVFNPPRV